MKPIYGFWHNAIVGHWKVVLKRQYKKLCDSGLLDASEKVILNTVGSTDISILPTEIREDSRITFSFNEDREVLEYDTLGILQDEVSDKDCNIWYIHVKGAISSGGDPTNNCWHWGEYMEYFTIMNWRKSTPILEQNDITGVEWREHPSFHYSGNFWWATSDYIKRLPLMKDYTNLADRIQAEFWIGQGRPIRTHCFYNFKDNLYISHKLRPVNWEIFK